MEGKIKKQIYKKWWFWILLIALILICILIFVNQNKSVGNKGISLKEYEQIKNGMTMTEVLKIVNSEDINNIASEQISREEDSTGTVYKYKYYGESKGYAIITYEYSKVDLWINSGMKVILKEQYGLK